MFLCFRLEVDLHVILATRMLLHLREWSQRENAAVLGDQLTDVDFSHPAGSHAHYYLSDMGSKRAPSPMQFQHREFIDPVKARIQTSTVVTSNGTTTITTIRGSDTYGPY
jgi:hypothetical protein